MGFKTCHPKHLKKNFQIRKKKKTSRIMELPMVLYYLILFLIVSSSIAGLVLGTLAYIQAKDNKDDIAELPSTTGTNTTTNGSVDVIRSTQGSQDLTHKSIYPNSVIVTLPSNMQNAKSLQGSAVVQKNGRATSMILESWDTTSATFTLFDLPRSGYAIDTIPSGLAPDPSFHLFEIAGYAAICYADANNDIYLVKATTADCSMWSASRRIVLAAERTAASPYTAMYNANSGQVIVAYFDNTGTGIEVQYASASSSLKDGDFTTVTTLVGAAVAATSIKLQAFEFESKVCFCTNNAATTFSMYQMNDITLTAATTATLKETCFTAGGAIETFDVIPDLSESSANSFVVPAIYYLAAGPEAQFVRPVAGANGDFTNLTSPFTGVLVIDTQTNVLHSIGGDQQYTIHVANVNGKPCFAHHDKKNSNPLLKTMTAAQAEGTSITATSADHAFPTTTALGDGSGDFAAEGTWTSTDTRITRFGRATNSARFNVISIFDGISWVTSLQDLGASGDASTKDDHRCFYTATGELLLFWRDTSTNSFFIDCLPAGTDQEVHKVTYNISTTHEA